MPKQDSFKFLLNQFWDKDGSAFPNQQFQLSHTPNPLTWAPVFSIVKTIGLSGLAYKLASVCYLKQVESEIISKLDVLVEGGKGDAQYKDLFYKM